MRPEITGRKIGVRYVGNVALARYLNVAPMSIWRWKRNRELNVPSAAVINAITDAIDNNKLEMPATPDRVWHAIHGNA